MKIGQYTVCEGKFKFRYLVRRIMKKTAIVSCLTYLNSELVLHNTHYRYPLDLLEQQIENAEYLSFNQKRNA